VRTVSIAIVLALALLVGVGPLAEGGDTDPTYVKRLRPPASGDRFHRPSGITTDLHTGEVFVCDSRGHRIVIFDSQGLYRHQILGGSLLRSPLDVAVDPEGYLFVTSVTGGKRSLFHLDFDGALVAEVDLASIEAETGRTPEILSVAITPTGDRLFVVDLASQRLWTLTREGGVLGSVDLIPDIEGEKREEQVLGKVDVYGDRVLVAVPTQGLVWVYDLEGRKLGHVGRKGSGPCQTGFPVAAVMDETGDVWILDRQRAMFMRWRLEGNQCLGQHYGFGNAAGAMYSPLDMTLDANGTLYVTQGFESRVQVYEGAPRSAGVPGTVPEPAAPRPSDPGP
jgi:DNA-binding beta-propeller fold protein YncE